jgi:hypothetical protein
MTSTQQDVNNTEPKVHFKFNPKDIADMCIRTQRDSYDNNNNNVVGVFFSSSPFYPCLFILKMK